jgi:hypothetical protein
VGVPDLAVTFTKYDGSLHWHLMAQRLGEDEHGVWTGLPAGSTMARGDEPPVVMGVAGVVLVPRHGWWVGWFNAEPHKYSVYCDITTPPVWHGDAEVTMVDLDLDVVRRRPGDTVELLDEDEFVEHGARYAYPDEIVAAAVSASRELLDAVAAGTGPFGGAHSRWLALVADEPSRRG